MTETTHGLNALFAGKDTMVRAIYDRLLDVVQTFGPFREEPKKTSIHLMNTSGFAGIHPRKSFLYLNVRMDRPLQSERVAKSEQVSKHRYHNVIKIIAPDEVDDELLGWLKEGYRLA
jgi:hypothetical protein